MKAFILMALAALVGPHAAAAQTRTAENPCVDSSNRAPQLRPVDEAPSDPEFLQYRARLRTAVEKRDIEALIDASDPAIRLGFDASGGRSVLKQQFTDRPELWEEMRVALALGGRFSSPMAFEAPYVYGSWPNRFDSFECAAITGRNVRFRAAPRLDASIITLVSYSIVRLLPTSTEKQWSHVQLGSGRTGYMWHAYVRSPVDYRALFGLENGRWWMTAFLAGD